MRIVGSFLIGLGAAGTLACTTPTAPPLAVSAIEPARGERIAVDQALILIDTSSSVARGTERVAQSFISGMPAGGYQAGALNFGGYEREVQDLARYDRAVMRSYASGLRRLGEGTPIHVVLAEAGQLLAGSGGRAAVVLISDGVPTDEIGRPVEPALAVEAARALAEEHGGVVCIHTVQIGGDPEGTMLLKQLSQQVGCGTYRSDASLASEAAYHVFERDVFLAAAQSPPLIGPGDADGDGVLDGADECPGTLMGARVDSRGCWTLPGANFATNSATLETEGKSRLAREVVPVLEQNPTVLIRIEGHTDSSGDAAYNQKLSERRAESVRSYLVSAGIRADRLEAVGYGEERPAVSNDSAENRRKNRRIELSIK